MRLPVNWYQVFQYLLNNLLANHRARKAMFIAFSLVILNLLQGFTILVAFMSDVFEKSNPNMSSVDSSIVITGMLILANFFYVNLIDRANRRTFYIWSSLITTVGHIVFALYLYFLADNHAFDWVPIIVMSFSLFVASLGMDPVPWIVMLEILPKKVWRYRTFSFFEVKHVTIFHRLKTTSTPSVCCWRWFSCLLCLNFIHLSKNILEFSGG